MISVAATSTKLEIVCEARDLALSELVFTRCTKAGRPLLSISVISISIAVLKAAFFNTTAKFSPIYRKANSLTMIMMRFMKAKKKRIADTV